MKSFKQHIIAEFLSSKMLGGQQKRNELTKLFSDAVVRSEKHRKQLVKLIGEVMKDSTGAELAQMKSMLAFVKKAKVVAGLKEDIKIPVGPGDWILGGKFKNKKIKIKTVAMVGGDLKINGRPAVKFRIPDAETQKRLKAEEK